MDNFNFNRSRVLWGVYLEHKEVVSSQSSPTHCKLVILALVCLQHMHFSSLQQEEEEEEEEEGEAEFISTHTHTHSGRRT